MYYILSSIYVLLKARTPISLTSNLAYSSELLKTAVIYFVVQFDQGVKVTQIVEDLTNITKAPMYGGDVTTVMDIMNDVISQVEEEISSFPEDELMNVISRVNEVRYILYVLTSEN